jgi:hypothetical protein
MPLAIDFTTKVEAKVAEQLDAQRVGYLLGAGSSYLNNSGYPLANQLWDRIKDRITDFTKREEIQAKLDGGAHGIEEALDLLDSGQAVEGPHRHLVTAAIAEVFRPLTPPLDLHVEFVKRLAQKADPLIKVFSLNYDPLIERAAERAKVRLCDGFTGHEHAYFSPSMFEERIGRIRGIHKGRQFDETTKPIHLMKLHGSLGWYECSSEGIRRCSFSLPIPALTKRLMIPPQRRKANDAMTPPYSSLWSAFRGSLGQNAVPINRLACFGYPTQIAGYQVDKHFFDSMADLGHRIPSQVVEQVAKYGQQLPSKDPNVLVKYLPGVHDKGVTVVINIARNAIFSAHLGKP